MRLHPRHVAVSKAKIDISTGMSNILRVLNLTWPDTLYHVARVKLQLLREMGVEYPDPLPAAAIPSAERVVSSTFYGVMLEYDLTQVELYQLITEWEFSAANGMLRLEREEWSHE